ncbi:hypothetical protein [Legionella hackeliae]|uniref:Uncharacterized protein n=1 Tax=Legionella hackeliae TaxID=449 RepID=A0A0A8UKX2_LEGHA|nr:hypothetical protein [Legionella hackeliae]KTD13541.1 hypothetical protein Lhac_0925 [Legionella hackeliae]CEK09388.1 protein of unknown function [Legionella hackeliae]STX49295.1 Uncharacterised protein [Legionella hackeliae]
MPFNHKEGFIIEEVPPQSHEDDIVIDDAPPQYQDVEPSSLASIHIQENSYLREENELLKKELALSKRVHQQLQWDHATLKEHNLLVETQLALVKETKQQLGENYATLCKNYVLSIGEKNGLIQLLRATTEQEERILNTIETELESCTRTLSQSPEIGELRLKMQEFEANLQAHKDEVSADIEKQIDEKSQLLRTNILELFDQFIHGEAFTQLVSDLEIKLSAIIYQEQEAFLAEANHIPIIDEVTLQYLDNKTKKLIALKQIRDNDKCNLFYNTSYIALWAKIIGIISVFSQLVEKKAGTGKKVLDLSADVIGGLLGSVPFVGPLLDTVTAFTLKEIGDGVLDYLADKRIQNILAILQNPDHAKKMAELFARSLTVRYQDDIQSWATKTIKHAATMYSNQVYTLSTSGKINSKLEELKSDSLDDKIEIFLNSLATLSEKEIIYDSTKEVTTPSSSGLKLNKSFPNEKSIGTHVQQQTQTLRKRVSETEFYSKHASVVVKGVQRQNSGLQQKSEKHGAQISSLESEVVFLRAEVTRCYEQIDGLQAQINGLHEIMADWLTPANTDTSNPAAARSKKSTSRFKLFNKKESGHNSRPDLNITMTSK